MKPLPCPICRRPVDWDNCPTRPFCSSRCQVRDLGAWSTEAYRVPERPAQEEGESWSECDQG